MKKRTRIKVITYNAVHLWLKYYFGNGLNCENCNREGRKTGRRWSLEYALIPGFKCEKKRENFKVLCKSCHRKMDYWESDTMQENFKKGWIKRKQKGLDLKRDNKGHFLTKEHGYKSTNS